MHVSSRSTKILAALIIAAAMISASFWLTSAKPRLANALSTDELLRAYVAQDTDDDGLPDWQEKVYGTDPGNPRSADASMTDADAVAAGVVAPVFVSEPPRETVSEADIPVALPADTSLTARFSRQFMEEYFAAGGGKNVSEGEQAKIVDNLITTFAQEAEERLTSSYTRLSLKVRSDVGAMAYIEELEAFMLSSLPTENSDMVALAHTLIEKGDLAAGSRLQELSRMYGAVAKGLLAMSVPSRLVNEHLLLVRAYDRVSRGGAVLAAYEQDPIAALGALSVFVPARNDIVTAFKTYAAEVLTHGEPAEGEAGALTVQFARAQEQP